MMKIAGSNSRTFTFPADIQTAINFYRDLTRLVDFLPHINMHEPLGDEKFRMIYSATEMGAYEITIVCDVQMVVSEDEGVIRVVPVDGFTPVKAKASFNSSQVQGYYASESVFVPDGARRTIIEYTFELLANLPRPKGLRFMPAVMVEGIAQNITQWRLREIVDGFIERSIAAFPAWQEAQRNGHALRD
ncbi:MAG: SRPBCC family protein [Anaerolineales bacterium]|nr:SRPBCC family protein [Anaerolineales bacterium]MCB8950520.1 SRPBCC family protein [Ardenticatenales bacterium]